MLQQTQVATVIPYFQRFLQRFPSVADLAAATEPEVLRLWEGLGYYRRAKQMHAAAQRIVSQHGGQFPTAVDQVLALPGIGRYTAGAILSISTDQRLPILEANTVRLYSRLIALRHPPALPAANRQLWQVAEQLLPKIGSGQFNQAAMELGALICVPATPKCSQCPLESLCPTRAAGLQAVIPGKVKQTVYEDRLHWSVILQREGRFLVRQCPSGEHWAGLWDFPRFDVTGAATPVNLVENKLKDEFGLAVSVGENVTSLRHGVTRFRIRLDVFWGQERSDSATSRVRETNFIGTSWFTPDELSQLPMSAPGRKLAKKISTLAAPP
jgi:A/G-specific adenine glycosylase